MADEISITIDGQEVKTTSDKTLIQAANEAGVYVPYLCYHPGMKPYGACRMCVVEVEGAPGTPASCTLPVREGMVVHTKSESVVDVRDNVMDLLLAEHPHGCLTCHRVDLCGPQDICLRHVNVLDRCVMCPKNERCELKDTTRYHTMEMNSPLAYQYRGLQIETKDPFYDRDYNLCIVCARCVRVCDEIRGDVALTLTERAGQVLVGTSMGESLLESGCEFCGACLDVCPVGALTESNYKWERASRYEKSVCNQCSVGCQMNYEVNNRERVIRAIPELNAPSNHGQACFKGKFGFDYVNSKERIKAPLLRRGGELQPASWEEAFQFIAERLPEYKGSEFALIADARATNEELYVAQKFARVVMRSNNIDVSSNQRPGIFEGLADVFGYYTGSGSISDLNHAACVLAISTNLTEDLNVASLPIKQRTKSGMQKLIVIDSREVELTRYSDLWLRPYPGTDLAVIGGMLKVIIDEGLADLDFVNSRSEGFDNLCDSLAPFTLAAVEQESGVPAYSISAAARMFAENAPASIIYALDNSTGGTRRITSRAIAELALVTGNIGKIGAAVLPVRLGANEQGAWDVGCAWRMLPGSFPMTDTEALNQIENQWGITLPEDPAIGIRGFSSAVKDGKIRAAFIMGDHPTYHDGTLENFHHAAESLNFLIAVDAFLSPIAALADVVLPAGTFLETGGTYTNVERRIQPLKKVFDLNLVNSLPGTQIISTIARHMGEQGFDFKTAEEIFTEIAEVVPQYRGISYKRLFGEAIVTARPSPDNPMPTQVQYSDQVTVGIQWPCTSEDESGTPCLYSDSFLHGKAQIPPLTWRVQPRHQDKKFPLLLTHGRVLAQPERPNNIIQIERVPKKQRIIPVAVGVHSVSPQINGISVDSGVSPSYGSRNQIDREERLLLCSHDALKFNLAGGQRIRAITPSGKNIEAVVEISQNILEGTASITTLFAELAVELDASRHPDMMNHVPRLEVEPVFLEIN